MKHFTIIERIKYLVLVIVVFCAGLGSLFIAKYYFTVKSIEVHGVDSVVGLDSLQNKFIFLVSVDKTKDILYEKNPLFRNIVVIKKYPSTIKISAHKDKIIAALKVSDGYFYLTSSARIIAKNKELSSAITIINSFEHIYLRSYSVGETIDTNDVRYSLYFISKLADLGINIKNVDIFGFDVLVFNAEGKTYTVTLSKGRGDQFNDIKLLINHFAIDGQDYNSIDVRFDKPIIKFKGN